MSYTPGGSRATIRLVSGTSHRPVARAKSLIEAELAFTEFVHPLRDRLFLRVGRERMARISDGLPAFVHWDQVTRAVRVFSPSEPERASSLAALKAAAEELAAIKVDEPLLLSSPVHRAWVRKQLGDLEAKAGLFALKLCGTRLLATGAKGTGHGARGAARGAGRGARPRTSMFCIIQNGM